MNNPDSLPERELAEYRMIDPLPYLVEVPFCVSSFKNEYWARNTNKENVRDNTSSILADLMVEKIAQASLSNHPFEFHPILFRVRSTTDATVLFSFSDESDAALFRLFYG